MEKSVSIIAAAAALITVFGMTAQAQHNPYFTGDGGKDIRLAVLEPAGKGLSEDDKWMLSLVQGSISGDFNKYSGITIIDRQNLEKVLGEWEESMSGNYSDEDRAKIGNLTNASHILTGNISKTANSFIIEFAVIDVQSGVRKASYSPKPVSLLTLENLSAVKEASADLLTQLGVDLTSAALAQLKQVENTAKIQAETMLARGISAQKQGTEVAALSYFFQAAILDPSLAEAVNRSSVMAANVSSGNIGEDTRNDIAWRKSWVKRLEETERYIDNLNKTVSMPYTLFYSDEIIMGDINYEKETRDLSIRTNLNGSNSIRVWALSVERALQAVHDGLEATGRKNVWNLNWPGNRVITDMNPFKNQSRTFTIVAELVNSRNKVIGSQEFKVGGCWEYKTWERPSVRLGYSDDYGRCSNGNGRENVKFKNVKADDITDNLTIRIANVNGEAAESAARKGVLQIKAMPKSEFDENDRFVFAFGEIKKYNGTYGINIPNTVWDAQVISIGESAFSSKSLTYVTIPDGVTSIGQQAFGWNKLTGAIIIPASVTFIGNSAFYNNELTSITIGENVTLDENAFGNGFEKAYQSNGRSARSFRRTSDNSGDWIVQMTYEEQEEQRQRLERLQLGYRKPEEENRQWQDTSETSTGTITTSQAYPASGSRYKEQEPSGGGSAFVGYGALLMTEQQSLPLYNQLSGQVILGFTIGMEFLHLGLKVEGIQPLKLYGEDSIKHEVLKYYPNIPRDDITIVSHNFTTAVLFARLYLGNYVYLSGGGGWWFHDAYVEENSEWGLNRIQLIYVEGVPVFNAGIGFVTGKKGGFFFDSYYNIVLRRNGPDQYVTINGGLQFGGRRRLSVN